MLINIAMENYLNDKLDPEVGYCAATGGSDLSDSDNSPPVYYVILYMNKEFNDYESLAKLFYEAGAFDVNINRQMYSDNINLTGNGDRDGYTTDGSIALDVSYNDNPYE